MTMPSLTWERVFAWAETKATNSWVARPVSIDECADAVAYARRQGLTICPRGAGYSYGDMILNDRHIILETNRLNKIIDWNPHVGRIIVEPGVTIAKILKLSIPFNWTITACVGGLGVTVGGAISNNVHGKDAFRTGNFCVQVVELKLLSPDGHIFHISPGVNCEIFRAVAGGMGLLGIVIEATLQLSRIPSPFVAVTAIPSRNLDELITNLDQGRQGWDFAVAWVDAFASGSNLGRGAVLLAKWIETSKKASRKSIEETLVESKYVFNFFPPRPLWGAMRPFAGFALIQMANAAKYQFHCWRGRTNNIMLFTDFNFIHRKIPRLEDVYRPFIEPQPLIPRKAGLGAISELFRLCQKEGAQSLLCGVKMHGPGESLLSYEGDGYSIGIDISLRGRSKDSIDHIAKAIYGYTAQLGGKIFLAKDELLSRDLFERMYPNWKEFLKIKKQCDPEGLFASDLYRRLLT